MFSECLFSVFSTDTPDPNTDLPPYPGSCLDHVDINVQDVYVILRSLDTTKAVGPDGIPTMVLKACAEELSLSLTMLFNKSLSLSRLPTQWKQATIVPVHIKGDKADVENYRPISLLCVLLKCRGKCIYNKVISHISRNMYYLQHGFLKGRSTVTQLLCVLHGIGKILAKSRQVDVIHLDYAKAFDTVPHSGICLNLKNWVSRGNYLIGLQTI